MPAAGVFLLVCALLATLPGLCAASTEPGAGAGRVYGFVPNVGQWVNEAGDVDTLVRFRASLPELEVFVYDNAVRYVAYTSRLIPGRVVDSVLSTPSGIEIRSRTIGCHLQGAQQPSVETAAEVGGQGTNYFLPACPKGIRSVPAYQKIVLKGVYPGIDWVLTVDAQGRLKSDFVVRAGQDPSVIRFRFEGVAGQQQLTDNRIQVSTPIGQLVNHRPESFQSAGRQVATQYHFDEAEQAYGFVFPQGYDAGEQLVIDPLVSWGTYFGGTGLDYINDAVYDSLGNLIVIGHTASLSIVPPVNPSYYPNAYVEEHTDTISGNTDLFIAKFDAQHQLKWFTFYGGSRDETEYMAVATDSVGRIYVHGSTRSPNFPVLHADTAAVYGYELFPASAKPEYDLYLLIFNEDGSREYATRFGGVDPSTTYSTYNSMSTANAYFARAVDVAQDIIVDHRQFGGDTVAIYVCGFTKSDESSESFPVECPGSAPDCDGTHSSGTATTDGSTSLAQYEGFLGKFVFEHGDTLGREWLTYTSHTTSSPNFDMSAGLALDYLDRGYDSLTVLVFGQGSGYTPLCPRDAFRPSAYVSGRSSYNHATVSEYLPNCDRVWGTYFGGGNSGKFNKGTVDINHNVVAAGGSFSTDWVQYVHSTCCTSQVTLASAPNSGDMDYALAVFNTDRQYGWATQRGSTTRDEALDVKLTTEGDSLYAWVGGYCSSTAFPGQNHTTLHGGAGYYDASHGGSTRDGAIWVANLSAFSNAYSSHIGGAGLDAIQAVAVSPGGSDVTFVGYTCSACSGSSGAIQLFLAPFPGYNDIVYGGNCDGFIYNFSRTRQGLELNPCSPPGAPDPPCNPCDEE